MPPKRKATAGSKPAALATRRQKMAAKETTTVEVYGFDKEWLKPLYEMYDNRELTNVVLKVCETCRATHHVVLATVSPYLRKMFGSGMADSNLASRGRSSCRM